MRDVVRIIRNGRIVELKEIRPGLTMLDYLRHVERQTGTKASCNAGNCGACTILVGRKGKDGIVYQPVNACTFLVAQADGAEIVTVEDLADDDGTLHPVQEALVEHHATRCGYCTAGMAMSLAGLYHRSDGEATEADVRRAIQGNACRCTGYRSIVSAGIAATRRRTEIRLDRMREDTMAKLEAIADDDEVFFGDTEDFVAIPRTMERAAAICTDYPAATVLAGGTALDAEERRRADPRRVVLLSRVAEATRIAHSEGAVTIGAAVPLQTAREALQSIDVDLAALVDRIGGRQHRSVASLGGDLMLGGRKSELAAALMALEAEAVFRIGEESRRVRLDALYAADGSVDHELGELMVEVHIPRLSGNAVYRCLKVSKRWDLAPPIVAGGFCFDLDPEGTIANARIAFTGLAAAPGRANAAEAALTGARPLDRAVWPNAFSALRQDFEAVGDSLGSARFRTETAQALLGKALIEAGGTSERRTRLRGFREEEGALAAR